MDKTNFFHIHMPYGIRRNADDTWFAFNREYMPLGWNSTDEAESTRTDKKPFQNLPIHSAYKKFNDDRIISTLPKSCIIRKDQTNQIVEVIFYDNTTDPVMTKYGWDDYLNVIRFLATIDTQ